MIDTAERLGDQTDDVLDYQAPTLEHKRQQHKVSIDEYYRKLNAQSISSESQR